MEETKRGQYGVEVKAAGREIDVGNPDTAGAQGWSYDAEKHTIHIFTPADYTLTGSTNENQVLIQPENPTSAPFQVVLEGVRINKSGETGSSAISIKGGAFARLLLHQSNSLYAGDHAAAVQVFYDSSLELDSLFLESYGSLYARGGAYAACIGANKGEAYGTITIQDVNLNLHPRSYGAGIGYGDITNGYSGSSGNIKILGGNIEVSNDWYAANGISCKSLEITGGRLEAQQYWYGSGIALAGADFEEGEIIIGGNAEVNVSGDYYHSGIDCYLANGRGKIIINGGVVTARGGYNAAGIGSGYYSQKSDSVIIINGGVVSAYGGSGGAGIGGGYLQNAGKIEINGGIVCAYGLGGAAGIGGGCRGKAKEILISSEASIIAESFNEYVDDIGTGMGMLTYTGLYSGIYSGELSGMYQGRLSGMFDGRLARNYTDKVACSISGEYNGMASGRYSGLFIGRYSGSLMPDQYSGLYTSLFEGRHSRSARITRF